MKKLSNIFEDIGFNGTEAANLKLRAELMARILKYIKQNGFTQEQAAEALKIDQPRVSKLLSHRLDLFSIDKLILILANIGITVQLKIAA